MAKTKNIAGCRVLKQANALIRVDLDNAILLYNQAIAFFRDAVADGEIVEQANLKNAYINLSVAQGKQDKLDEAIGSLTDALISIAGDAEITEALFNHRFNKASKALAVTDYRTVISELEEALKLNVLPVAKVEAGFYIAHAKVKFNTISTQDAIDAFTAMRGEVGAATVDAQLKPLYRKHAIELLTASNYAEFNVFMQKPLVAADADLLTNLLDHARFTYNQVNDVDHHKLAGQFFFGLHRAGNAEATADLETLLFTHDNDPSHNIASLGDAPDFANIMN